MQDDTTKDEVVEEVVADDSQAVVDDQQVDTTESTEEVAEQTEEVAPTEEETEVEETEEKPPSRREQLRIQSLLQKYPGLREKTKQQAPSKKSDALDYRTALDADDEVVKTLESDRQSYGQDQYQQGQSEALKHAQFSEWKMSLKIDAPAIEKKYPILDKDSQDFHPAVADAMNTWYLKMSGYDSESNTVASPGISYADFVEANMELVEEIAGQKNAQTVKNVAKQSAQTGLRPDGSTAPRMNLNKDPSEMTMDELYASIGQKNPHKK